MSNLTYKDAGVDIEAGDLFVERIKEKVKRTCGERVVSGVGGFACLYDVDGERYLAAGTDGVGTKLLVAQKLGIHNSIGIDLVLCVSTIFCAQVPEDCSSWIIWQRAKLDVSVSEQIVEGIVDGCLQAKVALIGGETAEMPGMYGVGKYDLAGFAVGEVYKKDVIDGSRVQNGDAIVGIASSGIHSNGLSFGLDCWEEKENDEEYWKALLVPTRIYTPYIEALQSHNIPIHGLAHITGGGIQNINRIHPQAQVKIDSFPDVQDSEVAGIFRMIKERSQISDDELLTTFNMGVGMAVVTPKPQETIDVIRDMGVPAMENRRDDSVKK